MKINGIPEHEIESVWNKQYPERQVKSTKALSQLQINHITNLIRHREAVTLTFDGKIIGRVHIRDLVCLALSGKAKLRKEIEEMDATTVGSILATDKDGDGLKKIQHWKLQDFADNYDYLERGLACGVALDEATKKASEAIHDTDFYAGETRGK